MDDNARKTRRKLFAWAIGMNVVAWGGYLYLTINQGCGHGRIDFEGIDSLLGGQTCRRLY